MQGWLVQAWRGVQDAVLPPQCLACGARLAVSANLCGACWNGLNFIDQPFCERLGTPFETSMGEGITSARALTHPPVWDRARAAVTFDELARDLVHGLKYYDRMENADLMARMMARAGAELLGQADILIPVPLYRWRLWKRRFNQAGLLADRIGKASGHSVLPELLLRQRATATQVGLKAAERRVNLRKAFHVLPENRPFLAGRRVLLVDDVMTTGSTASAASLALLEAGAAAVDVLVFALVAEPFRTHI
ncbi:MAG: ComF family protein [Aestuariivirgaceae bacterium]|nr:ComF family protein [Aestuariivirgaceae bacterium]